MNGRRVMVVGLDPPSVPHSNRRIHVKLLDPNDDSKPVGNVLQIKSKNLVDPRSYCSATPEPTLSKDEALKYIQQAYIQQAYKNGLDQGHDKMLGSEDQEARDRPMRMKLIKEKKYHLPVDDQQPKIECMDPLIAPNKQNSLRNFQISHHSCLCR